MPFWREFITLFRKHAREDKSQAQFDFNEYRRISFHVREKLGMELKGLKVLEIGCGQRYPYSLMLADDNNVRAIDKEIILYKWSPALIVRLLARSSLKRSAKTIIRKMLFDRKYYRELQCLAGRRFRSKPSIDMMAAEDLKFPEKEFDFVFSVAVFEHIAEVDRAVANIKRILKPAGAAAIGINVFTGITGGHNLFAASEHDLRGRQVREMPVPPWDHLRQRRFPPNSYLNEYRIADYKRIFENHFEEIHYYEEEHPDHEIYLTDGIRKELSDYSEHELFTDWLLILCRK